MPGSVPGQSCAGLWAAGTGTAQETAPPQLHRGPAAQRRPPINTTLSHSQTPSDRDPPFVAAAQVVKSHHGERKLMLYIVVV